MISGICSICGKVTKKPHSCLSCGATICEEHYDFSSGFCPRCKRRLADMEGGI
ncbi:MAG: orotate phosphoribosyltransferase [Candidatus Aenigmatarchaeota archaeon]